MTAACRSMRRGEHERGDTKLRRRESCATSRSGDHFALEADLWLALLSCERATVPSVDRDRCPLYTVPRRRDSDTERVAAAVKRVADCHYQLLASLALVDTFSVAYTMAP